jgi:hypothetical protein
LTERNNRDERRMEDIGKFKEDRPARCSKYDFSLLDIVNPGKGNPHLDD